MWLLINNFDVTTLSAIVALAFVLQSITLLTFFLLANEYHGIGLAVIGNLLFACGFSLVLLRGPFTDMDLVELAIPLSVVGAALLAAGFARFSDHWPQTWWLAGICGSTTMAALFFQIILAEVNMRIAVASLGTGLLLGRAGVDLLRVENKNYRSAAILAGIPLLVYALFLVYRVIDVLTSTVTLSLFDPGPQPVLFFLMVFICGNMWNSGFILMITRRLYIDHRIQARRDYLTKLNNRRAMQEILERACAHVKNTGENFSILLIDVDHFKAVNDRFGHAGGDQTLQHIGNLLSKMLRPEDTLARWGGEEFLIVLKHTDLGTAVNVAERLRQQVDATPAVLRDGPALCSISVGVANANTHGASVDALLRAADAALYSAKQAGRNRVVAAGSTPN